MTNDPNVSKSCFSLKEESQHAAKGNKRVNISITCCTVSSDLSNVQVYRRRMVEADVALNFDPHSLTNTTNLMPTNVPILPFLVLTMAGGCGVSNLMKQSGNNSWVCVWKWGWRWGRGGRGVESRHKCPCESQGQAIERAALTATTSPKWLPVKAPEKETAVSLRSAL